MAAIASPIVMILILAVLIYLAERSQAVRPRAACQRTRLYPPCGGALARR